MNDQARDVLGQVIKNYGPSICHTPRSCELFLRQECAAYPDESRVLIHALQQGIASELIRYHPADKSWEKFTGELRSQLARTGLKEAEGSWAIDSWARVLGRHPDDWAESPPPPRAPHYPVAPRDVSRSTVVTATTIIVAIGGFLGGALGAMLVPAAILVTQAAVDMPFMKELMSSGGRHYRSKEVWMFVALALGIVGMIGGTGGGVGAALGWLHGKGDTRPWRGFTVALSATFTTTALVGHFCGVFGWFFGALFSGFGSARACASRGGLY